MRTFAAKAGTADKSIINARKNPSALFMLLAPLLFVLFRILDRNSRPYQIFESVPFLRNPCTDVLLVEAKRDGISHFAPCAHCSALRRALCLARQDLHPVKDVIIPHPLVMVDDKKPLAQGRLLFPAHQPEGQKNTAHERRSNPAQVEQKPPFLLSNTLAISILGQKSARVKLSS